ncbi:uncharacterized protein LOC133747358 isoform X1 [Lepus europaeus]|uniref:uncharacterized protein LOC133747358 isoform X1 n=1 Tax=Lepus europaeus TaxID=9983 RepID=UPI002B494AD8|nr:uncharacterized protein LOC133747358 isoform X1 [Lepus europaeus]
MDSSLLAIVAAAVSSTVFIMAILLRLLYQRDLRCCQVLCSCHFFRSPSRYAWPPPCFSTTRCPTPEVQPVERSRVSQGVQVRKEPVLLSLRVWEEVCAGVLRPGKGPSVLRGPKRMQSKEGGGCWRLLEEAHGIPCLRLALWQRSRMEACAPGSPGFSWSQGHPQGDEVFCVGLTRSHQMPLWQPARLPSYESVRKKDRQQQIHQLIAQRFGLWACRELPPSYEEAVGPLPAPSPSCGSVHPSQEVATFPALGNTTV